MIRDLGYIEPGKTLYVPFHTFDSNDPSASVTLTGLATTDVEIFKDGSITQRGSDNGYTLLDTDGIDFDGITGIHGLSIDLADNTTAGFYAAGSQYWVVIASVTVDAATINFIACTFRIGYQAAHLNTTIATLTNQTSFTLTSGPAEDDALNGQWAIIHDVASGVQKAQVLILDYTGSTKTVTLAAGATFTVAASDNFSVMGMAPLQPTTTGRTLDVSSGGEAGVDWANVGSQSTSVNLSATTIATLTNAVTLPTIPTDWITSGGLAASAVTEIQSGLATSSALTTVDTNVSTLLTRLGTPSNLGGGATVAANLSDIESQTDDIGAAGAGLTALATAAELDKVPKSDGTVTWNATALASLQSEANDALVAFFTSSAALVDAIYDEALSGHTTVGTGGATLTAAKGNTDYPDGYVYFSSFFGTAGTTSGVNGTWRNPVSSIANALTLANDIGGIKFMPNSSATASSGSLSSRVIDVHGGALTVAAGVSLSNALIYSSGRRGNLYGTALAQVTTSSTFLENLYISGIIATTATLELRHCGLSGDVTDSTGGPSGSFRPLLIDCYNFKGNGSAVSFDLTSGGHWHLLGWYGDLEVAGMGAGQEFYCNGWGKLTIAASCTGGTIKHTSHVEITDLASGAVTTELISEPSGLSVAGDTSVANAVWASGARTLTALGFTLAASDFGTDWLTNTGLAASAASEIADATWASATRTITALDEDTTTIDLDATIRAAVGLASANLDTQLGDLPTAAENAAALLASDVETGKTLLQCIRAIAAAAAGRRTGSGTDDELFDAIGNPGTPRIETNADAAGDGTPTLTLT